MKVLFFIFVLAVLLIVLVLSLFRVVQVVGNSMYPTYKDSEILLAYTFFREKKLKIGDVVVFRPPYDMGEVKVLIKRINMIDYDKDGDIVALYFLGDNLNDSFDSRDYGFVCVNNVIAKLFDQRKKVKEA